MGWLRRGSGASASAVASPAEPAAPAPLAEVEHAAPGLKQALERLPKPGASVLDLGPVQSTSISFFNRLGGRLRVFDLEDSLREARLWSSPAKLTAWEKQVGGLLAPCAGESYDLVLAWDLPNHLGRERWACVARILVARLNPGGMFHLLARTGREMPATPSRYRWIETDRLCEKPATTDRAAAPRLSHGEIERLHPGLAAAKSFLDKHGLQEFLLEHADELNLPPRPVAQPRKPRSYYPG